MSFKSAILPFVLVFAVFAMNSEGRAQSIVPASPTKMKVVAYYTQWSVCDMPPQKIDWSAITHLIYFWGEPTSTPPYFSLYAGSSDSTTFEIGTPGWCTNPSGRTHQQVIQDSARAHGVKLILCVGGEWGNNASLFSQMVADTSTGGKQDQFIDGALGFAQRHHYDGIDVNWEFPDNSATGRANYDRFCHRIRAKLDAWSSPGLFTMAMPTWFWYNHGTKTGPVVNVSTVNTCFDFVDLEEYGMENTSAVSFYSPIYPNPAVSQETWDFRGINEWVGAGVLPSKLVTLLPFECLKMTAASSAIGSPASGASWIGIRDIPSSVVSAPIWDAVSRSSYGWSNGSLYLFETQQSISEKIKYIQAKAIAGVGIWELWRGWVPGAPTGQQQPLLSALKSILVGTVSPSDTAAPSISITSPLSGATVSGTVSITATASDNVGVVRVDFLCNGTVLGSSSTTPFTWRWATGTVTGSATLMARAYDAAGNVGTSSSVVVSVAGVPLDTINPTVSVTSPVNGATVSGTVNVTAAASDNVGVTKVDFLVNGSVVGSSSSSPYACSWNTSGLSGSQAISARAYDAAGNVGSSPSVSVTVPSSAPPDSGSLTIYGDALQSPWINSSWSSTNNLTSTDFARSGNYSIQTVQNAWGALRFHSGQWGSTVNIDPNGFSTVSFAVYAPSTGLNLQVSVGSDSNTAFHGVICNNIPSSQWFVVSLPISQLDSAKLPVSYLTIQNWSSGTVTYYVDDIQFGGSTSQSDTSHPTVSITNPANNATVSGTFQVIASASDKGKLVGVQFACDGANVGQKVTAPPFACSFNSMQYANGIHTITATAQDSAGLTASTNVLIMISNISPTLTGGVTVRDNFDAPVSNVSLAGRSRWVNLTSQSGKATLQIVNNAVQPYNRRGYGNCGGVAWDSLMSAGTQVGIIVRQKGGNGSTLSFCINVRMNNEDLSAGNGYRLRYIDNPYGTDQLSLQRVTGSKSAVTLCSVSQEIHAGDTLSVQVLNDSAHTIVAFVNSAPVLATRDTVYNPSSWYVWLYGAVFSNPVRVDNFMCGSITVSATTIPSALLQDNGTPQSGGGSGIPTHYTLFQNYPNPFNPSTNIGYELPVPAEVSLIVYNILGSEVARLAAGQQAAGIHAVVWNASDEASGLYFARLLVRDRNGNPLFRQTTRMLLTK